MLSAEILFALTWVLLSSFSLTLVWNARLALSSLVQEPLALLLDMAKPFRLVD
tara:strand:- start:353 stop:511 length:159 start_codon:yes stop_codon:yes gene_type:complete